MDKPVSITVFAIVNICLAGMGMLGGCYSLLSPMIVKATNPALAEAYTGAVLAITIFLALIGLVSKSMMLGSGIGMLKGQLWGWKLGRLWAFVSIGVGLVTLILNTAVVIPVIADATIQDMQNQPNGPVLSPQFYASMKTFMYVSAVFFGLVYTLPYQITFLIMMKRQAVKDYFFNAPQSESY